MATPEFPSPTSRPVHRKRNFLSYLPNLGRAFTRPPFSYEATMKKLFFVLFAFWIAATPAGAEWNGVENFPFKNISATPAAFTLRGGNYGLTCHATWGGGSITLQRLSPDGSTY